MIDAAREIGEDLSRLAEAEREADAATRPVVGVVRDVRQSPADEELASACLAAVWWPARRASATDPAIALREE